MEDDETHGLVSAGAQSRQEHARAAACSSPIPWHDLHPGASPDLHDADTTAADVVHVDRIIGESAAEDELDQAPGRALTHTEHARARRNLPHSYGARMRYGDRLPRPGVRDLVHVPDGADRGVRSIGGGEDAACVVARCGERHPVI